MNRKTYRNWLIILMVMAMFLLSAGSSYTLLSKGDGQTAFEGCTVLEEGNRIDNAVLIDYITQKLNGQIGADYADPYGQGRITIVEEAQ